MTPPALTDEQIAAAEGLFERLNDRRGSDVGPDGSTSDHMFVLFGLLLGEVKRLRAELALPIATALLAELGAATGTGATWRAGWSVKLYNRTADGVAAATPSQATEHDPANEWVLEISGRRAFHRYIGTDLATVIARAHAGEPADR